jgi:hypothetical protein
VAEYARRILATFRATASPAPVKASLDLALSKSFHIRESSTVDLRAEFFNAPNQPNLANPINNFNAVSSSNGLIDQNTGDVLLPGNFGRIVSTSSNLRIIQLSLRLHF